LLDAPQPKDVGVLLDFPLSYLMLLALALFAVATSTKLMDQTMARPSPRRDSPGGLCAHHLPVDRGSPTERAIALTSIGNLFRLRISSCHDDNINRK
jgi:hypothetical protein